MALSFALSSVPSVPYHCVTSVLVMPVIAHFVLATFESTSLPQDFPCLLIHASAVLLPASQSLSKHSETKHLISSSLLHHGGDGSTILWVVLDSSLLSPSHPLSCQIFFLPLSHLHYLSVMSVETLVHILGLLSNL